MWYETTGGQICSAGNDENIYIQSFTELVHHLNLIYKAHMDRLRAVTIIGIDMVIIITTKGMLGNLSDMMNMKGNSKASTTTVDPTIISYNML